MRPLLSAFLTLALVLETMTARAQPSPTPIPAPPSGVQVIVVDGAPAGGFERQQWLELRMRELQVARSQYRIGGPIALMGVGGGVLLLFGSMALAFETANALDTGVGGTTGSNGHAAKALGIIALGGAVMIVVGAVLLSKRLRQRHQFDPEIRDIRQELRMMRQAQPRYGVEPFVHGRTAGLSLRLSF